MPKLLKTNQLGSDNVIYSIDEKVVPTNDLIKYFKNCVTKSDSRLKLKLDIDCDLEEYKIEWRFKLYKLKLPQDCNYSAYAVWSLNEKIVHNDEFAWYKALCKEIGMQEGEDVGVINLFLHDKDITSSTFKVRHYNRNSGCKDFSFLPDNVKLNVALFQHNDEIGKILSSIPSNNEEKIKLLEEASTIMEKSGKLSFLYDLSDCIARWGTDGKRDYEKKKVEGSIYGITDLKDSNDDLFDIYNDIKKRIDDIISKKA